MRQPSVAVIGTGFGGLAAAIELKRSGLDDLVIFERGPDVGGVWRENTYPGAACDVPSPYYSFSFEPNRNWPRRFAGQPAILDYLRGVANKYDLRRHIRFGTEVTAAHYVETTRTWRIRTGDGTVEVDVLVSAVGQLSRPSWPDIPGRETFRGAALHSAQWDHDVELAGKRVAVIGTGASAVQFVPEIQPEVAHLTVFQRSPAHLVPRSDTEFGYRAAHKVRAAQLIERAAWWGFSEAVTLSFLRSEVLSRALTAYSRRHMRRQVPDPDLFEKVWPQYPIGCKRMLFSGDYLPALAQSDVDVIDTRISVWTKCTSWYRDATGRISTNWPGTSLEYRRRAAFQPSVYEPAD
ncbi:NAD(P)/FAD-dependent oxidoreductase [Saccharopolyspora sp. NFXS83]|uniref:flavin-containing monooxygenase n=1 Tax=Saccharopolyspora sp. NFXS83 TaxID=2993560 RepID=UPI00224A65A3|nr:NAD(P)/FAD-dependent oxidoreductase [Saccharopolyspora sp. NFXS83]MCX2730087.1 NAD(P)/FAD-dependent oxidoreductase [Saccharopolyspora sp. NFXS83]